MRPLVAVILVLLFAVPAAAYRGEEPATVTVTSLVAGVEARCGDPIMLLATVLGPSGTGIPDHQVRWAITEAPPGAEDRLASTTTVTNERGRATNEITLDCVVGRRVITIIGPVGGSITIVLGAEGLPRTDTHAPREGGG